MDLSRSEEFMVPREEDLVSLREAIRHCRAGLEALEAAHKSFVDGKPYPTYLQVAGAELAHAIEVALQVSLRNR
jgi:hypothetical protein